MVLQPQIAQIFLERLFPFSSCLGALGGALWIATNRYEEDWA
jgi:hypothetical protein